MMNQKVVSWVLGRCQVGSESGQLGLGGGQDGPGSGQLGLGGRQIGSKVVSWIYGVVRFIKKVVSRV